jgi:CspA family cold shock protein
MVRCIRATASSCLIWSGGCFLHVTVLDATAIKPFTKVRGRSSQRAKGYQAFRILSMDESMAIHPAQMRRHGPMSRHADQRSGAAGQWFNRLRGSGLTQARGRTFVHRKPCAADDRELRPGHCAGPVRARVRDDGCRDQPETGSPGLSSH